MSATATVRVHPRTRDALRRLAAAHATTIPEVLREVVQRAEDDELLGGMEGTSPVWPPTPSGPRAIRLRWQRGTSRCSTGSTTIRGSRRFAEVEAATLIELRHRLHLLTRPPTREAR